MTNKEKATAVLHCFETGDATAMRKYLDPNKYTQHNLSFPDGAAAPIDATESGAFKGTEIETVRTISDGDFVVLQSAYKGTWNGGQPQVVIDVFRFEDGLIVEHWDNMMPLAAKPNQSGHTQLDGINTITDLEKTAANKTLAKGYINTVLVEGQFDKIHDFVKGDHYIQHHPDIADGISGLTTALGGFAKQGIHMVYNKVHYVHGQGNFALIMSDGKFAEKPFAYFDFLRLEEDRVVEHWGIMAPILPETEWGNSNGKF